MIVVWGIVDFSSRGSFFICYEPIFDMGMRHKNVGNMAITRYRWMLFLKKDKN
jgi:hypothetical protein